MSKKVGCWESYGNVLICTPQVEILFQNNFFFHIQTTFPASLLSLCDFFFFFFLCFHLTTWFLTFCQTFCSSSGRYLYLCAMRVSVCASVFCVCRLWENQTWRGTSGILSDIAWPFCLAQSCSYTHRASGEKCLNSKFGTNIFRCFIYSWNEMRTKRAVC